MNLHEIALRIGEFLKDHIEKIIPIYPVIASKGAPETFCVYRRTGFKPSSTKDGVFSDTMTILISIVSPTHVEGIEKASKISSVLNGMRGRWKNLIIESIRLADATEEFRVNSYVQHLYFSITLSL